MRTLWTCIVAGASFYACVLHFTAWWHGEPPGGSVWFWAIFGPFAFGVGAVIDHIMERAERDLAKALSGRIIQ